MRNESKQMLIGFLVTYFIIGLLCFAIGRWCYVQPIEPIIDIDTTIVTKIDTLYDTVQQTSTDVVEVWKETVKTDTVYTKDGNELTYAYENKLWKDTMNLDKDTLQLRIFTCGINVRLDSIGANLSRFRIKEQTTTTIQEQIKQKKPRFVDRIHISPQVGFGYGFFEKKPDIYAGIGVSYTL